MNRTLINVLLSSFLLGALLGILIGISINYPIKIETIQVLDTLCKEHGGWDTSRITITGKSNMVTCKDGVELSLAKIQQVRPQLPNSEPQK